MVDRKGRGKYSTLIMRWKWAVGWTARIQYLMGDGQAARGNSRPNDWCKHCQWGTQHSVGGGWVSDCQEWNS
ncbi:hypothetical protein T06_6828 [Trichinella sp. T6]|nr:hypothetical protein T06_6828 [Trichinella sp. T6]